MSAERITDLLENPDVRFREDDTPEDVVRVMQAAHRASKTADESAGPQEPNEPQRSEAPAKPKEFHKNVTLGKDHTPDEAIQVLMDFHGATSEAIKVAFSHLRAADPTDIVRFDTSVSRCVPCLKYEVHNSAGKWKGNGLIDRNTGQPIQHVS
jgi:hypothetical protein